MPFFTNDSYGKVIEWAKKDQTQTRTHFFFFLVQWPFHVVLYISYWY